MNDQFNELTHGFGQSVTRRTALKQFGVSLAGLALACIGLATAAVAQTSVVCDPAGDAARGSGKAKGSPIPLWLDISQGQVAADLDGNILFTLTMNAPIPTVPAWSGIDGGGELTWGWRLIDNLANLTLVRNGCLGGNGNALPAAYYLDLIWNAQTSSFQARLLDYTSCTEVIVPFAFSANRTQITLVVAKNLLANPSLVPDPDSFQYLAATVSWNSDSMGNSSYHHLDWAPDLSDGELVLCNWSASSDSMCSC